MSHPSKQPLVNQMEQWLAELEPASPAVCRDTVLFETGRALGRTESSGKRATRFWQATTAVAVATACWSLSLHWHSTSPEMADTGAGTSQPARHIDELPVPEGSPVPRLLRQPPTRRSSMDSTPSQTDLPHRLPSASPFPPADPIEAALDTTDVLVTLDDELDDLCNFDGDATPALKRPELSTWELLVLLHSSKPGERP